MFRRPDAGGVERPVRPVPADDFTLGGVRTSIDGEVLDVDDQVIPGLLAAGRTTSGLQAGGYISGTSLGDGTFFGRRAGRQAARWRP